MMTASDLARDVGQLLWLGFEGVAPPAYLLRDIAAGRVGAVILFRRNLALAAGSSELDIAALVALNDTLHGCVSAGEAPLWIAVDQEGGRVQRVRAPAPAWPPMLTLGEPDGASQAEVDRGQIAAIETRCRKVGRAMGRELAALGFDVDFAPVLDVHTNEANPVIGDRAFSRDPERAAAAALAFAEGLADAGILGCGKHFPGHGDTDTDSHLALPRLDHDMARLRAVELLPFRRAIAAGIPMIMTAHVIFAVLDERVPATLSELVIKGLLRSELGYSGIVVSDDLDMRAISAHFGVAEAAVQALRAGCDALLLCRDRDHQETAYAALLRAAERDSHVRTRIAESAHRIRIAKAKSDARARAPANADTALRLFAEHRQLLHDVE